MCDRLLMHDGIEIESIREDGACLCNSTDEDILRWIVEHVPELQIGTTLQIKRDPFGWTVAIVKENGYPRSHLSLTLSILKQITE